MQKNINPTFINVVIHFTQSWSITVKVISGRLFLIMSKQGLYEANNSYEPGASSAPPPYSEFATSTAVGPSAPATGAYSPASVPHTAPVTNNGAYPKQQMRCDVTPTTNVTSPNQVLIQAAPNSELNSLTLCFMFGEMF